MRLSIFVLCAGLVAGCARHPAPAASNSKSPDVNAAGGAGAAVDSPQSIPQQKTQVRAAGSASGPAHAAESADDHAIAAGTALGNLVVYPVTSHSQVDVGPLALLDDAIAQKTAFVREKGGGGSVNSLEIENKGKVPVFVLAGTIVKGGNQDRQIGQDFIIEPGQTTPVDAFCVEHGRWQGNRNGQATNGSFGTSEVLASSKVRAAGQYKKDQSEVWSQVASSNAANHQAPASSTFLATVDDATITRQRNELASKIDAALNTVNPQDQVVGIAYAIDGDVKGVRWFAHHDVFQLVRRKLVVGIAFDTMMARADAIAQNRPPSTKAAPTAPAVEAFVQNADKAAVKEDRDTPAANVNEYKETPGTFSSKTMFKGSASKPGASPRKPVSTDVMSK